MCDVFRRPGGGNVLFYTANKPSICSRLALGVNSDGFSQSSNGENTPLLDFPAKQGSDDRDESGDEREEQTRRTPGEEGG